MSGFIAPSKTSPQTPADVLRAAADLIEPEGAWTQGTYARTASGAATFASDPSAACWCAEGAIFRTAPAGEQSLKAVFTALKTVTRRSHVPSWNDAESRTQPEVVAALRKAADRLDREGRETARGPKSEPAQ